MLLNDIELLVSTRQAAQLLRVHESSVKRWCNMNKLTCRYTPGGHRRIPLEALMQVARWDALPCRLLALHPFENDVWQAVSQVWSDQCYEKLVGLLYARLHTGEEHWPVTLLRFLLEMDFSLSTLFDRLVSPTLHRIGLAWQTGTLAVGDEHRMTEGLRDSLYALLFDLERPLTISMGFRRVAVVGCGSTEAHELGALMIRLSLSASGWEVVYLGGRVPAEDFALQQVQHAASLVCVSFAPPQGKPDAIHLIHLLGRLYDAARPYRLVLGGSGLRGGLGLPETPAPFLDVRCFEETQTFSAWLTASEA